ncbi:MAG: hypothetical protein IJX53_00115 [Clostridia bacterium]|nr:hypothetical protein [Clostridia bacterium]
MIRIHNTVKRTQHNFWNHCHFHPTDAIEDAWGRRILDRLAADGAVRTVRMYTMLEDIVYRDENGALAYDFRVNDLRLDYMIERGFNILLSFNFMPECIASDPTSTSCVSKNKTRYKGKLINTSAPTDYRLWEEICYTYAAHIIARYGIERVSQWYCQCFNEPDIQPFFLSQLPDDATETRLREYCKLYAAFARGLRRASPQMRIGGPALARHQSFLGGFLDFVRENDLQLDFISIHSYGTSPARLNAGTRPLTVQNNLAKCRACFDTIAAHGFGDTELVIDEWGAASAGFFNRDECPELMFRETEVFSAYYVKLIDILIRSGLPVSKMLICLSGQHEMTEDFSGFRNFFTLNFIAKPIYNAYLLAAKLGEGLLEAEHAVEDLAVIPTKTADGGYAVLLTYAGEHFEPDLPAITETLTFAEDIAGRQITVWRIDRETTNPYRLREREGMTAPTAEQLNVLREEGRLRPVLSTVADGAPLPLCLTANSTVLVTVSAEKCG